MIEARKMKLLKQIGPKLPVLRKSQVCEVCGETFACEISLGKGCWCGEIKLSDETRQELRAKYKNCLCRACLENAAAPNSTSEAKANTYD
jgi:hypothetical protein